MNRDAFLENVRTAARAGRAYRVHPPKQAHWHPHAPPDHEDLVAMMVAEVDAVGGAAHVCRDARAARSVVAELLRKYEAKSACLWDHPMLDRIDCASILAGEGIEPMGPQSLAEMDDASRRLAVFRADVGITGADYAVAESGTIAVFSNPRQPRLASLAPPVHIALIDASQILRTLFDLFDALADKPGCLPGETTNDRAAGGTLPSNLTLITGPSKTGDIELRLTTGVHGPGHLHVVVVEESGLGVS